MAWSAQRKVDWGGSPEHQGPVLSTGAQPLLQGSCLIFRVLGSERGLNPSQWWALRGWFSKSQSPLQVAQSQRPFKNWPRLLSEVYFVLCSQRPEWGRRRIFGHKIKVSPSCLISPQLPKKLLWGVLENKTYPPQCGTLEFHLTWRSGDMSIGGLQLCISTIFQKWKQFNLGNRNCSVPVPPWSRASGESQLCRGCFWKQAFRDN